MGKTKGSWTRSRKEQRHFMPRKSPTDAVFALKLLLEKHRGSGGAALFLGPLEQRYSKKSL